MVLAIYVLVGIYTTPILALLPSLVIISLAGTLIETLPLKDIDNITVTLTAVILGYFLF